MPSRSRSCFWTFPLLAGLPLLGGCAGGLEFAALGAVAKAASTGSTVMKFGKIDVAVLTTPEVVADATYATFDELGLRVFFDGTSDDRTRRRIVAMNPDGREYKIILKPISPAITSVRLDIGLFGYAPVGQLISVRLRENLQLSGVRSDSHGSE